MDNIISLSIIIIIGFVLYISNKESFTNHQCDNLLVADGVEGEICL